jgi:hypothetical protein
MTLNKKLTKSEFRKRADKILMRLSLDVMPFWADSEEKQRQRVERAERDPLYFCRTYLPHYFPHAPAAFHYELVQMLEQRDGNVVTPIAVAAPREFAKTTVCSFGYVLHQICFRKRHFILIASDTEDLASDLTGYIYLELLYNERLHQDFGELVKGNRAVDDFVTLNDIRVKSRGRGQRLRGLKHKQHRPDLAILDDLENDNNVRNPEIVQSILDWVKSAVYPALDARGTLMVIGTILRWRSALHLMLTSSDEPYCNFQRCLYRAYQDDGTSLWEARHPAARLKLQKQLMGSVAFNREKMNEPAPDSGFFQEAWVHYYHPDSLKDRDLVVTGFFDPSMETGATSDYKAFITVGWCRRDMVFYVMDAVIQKTTLEQVMRTIYNRHQQFGYQVVGWRTTFFNGSCSRNLIAWERSAARCCP